MEVLRFTLKIATQGSNYTCEEILNIYLLLTIIWSEETQTSF